MRPANSHRRRILPSRCAPVSRDTGSLPPMIARRKTVFSKISNALKREILLFLILGCTFWFENTCTQQYVCAYFRDQVNTDTFDTNIDNSFKNIFLVPCKSYWHFTQPYHRKHYLLDSQCTCTRHVVSTMEWRVRCGCLVWRAGPFVQA